MGNSKYKLKILYDVDGWAYHHRANALARYAPPDFDVSLAAFNRYDGHPNATYDAEIERVLNGEEPDILFSLSQTEITFLRQALIKRGWKTKLVASWNCGWPRRKNEFQPVYEAADAVVINNFESWHELGRLPRTFSIANGVDLSTFRTIVPIESRPPKVLWSGSRYHRTTKGYDNYVLPLMDILKSNGISCEALLVDSMGNEMRSPEEMAEWYNQGTVYICASETEGTPNTALEAAACGCVIVSTPVGNMPELIQNGENGYLVERSVDALYVATRMAIEQYLELSGRLSLDIEEFGWSTQGERFYTMFRELTSLDNKQSAGMRPGRLDLSGEVTVFVPTVGAASFEACIEHLGSQDSTFKLDIIDRIAPMSAAFQQMLDRCTTPYFVQADEDMLLAPHAVRVLLKEIKNVGAGTAIYCASLWDEHLDRAIAGVKIYRHEIVNRYPYADVMGCEIDQLKRMRDDNYVVIVAPVDDVDRDSACILGAHGMFYTRRSIFERYFTLECKRRRDPRMFKWLEEYRVRFMQRFFEDPSELNFFALMGLLAGRRIAYSGSGKEKDFRLYNELPGLQNAIDFFETLTGSGQISPLQIESICDNPEAFCEDMHANSASARKTNYPAN